jgi:hypothetical protein
MAPHDLGVLMQEHPIKLIKRVAYSMATTRRHARHADLETPVTNLSSLTSLRNQLRRVKTRPTPSPSWSDASHRPLPAPPGRAWVEHPSQLPLGRRDSVALLPRPAVATLAATKHMAGLPRREFPPAAKALSHLSPPHFSQPPPTFF